VAKPAYRHERASLTWNGILPGAADTLAAYKPRLAISMEHKPTDPDELPPLVKSLNRGYQTRCETCKHSTGRLQPEELLAW
jgi:hypothetical protein